MSMFPDFGGGLGAGREAVGLGRRRRGGEGAVGVGLETQPLAATKQGSSSRQRPERSPDMLKYSAQHVAPFPLAAVGQEAPQAMARRMSTRAGMRSGEQLTRRRRGDAG